MGDTPINWLCVGIVWVIFSIPLILAYQNRAPRKPSPPIDYEKERPPMYWLVLTDGDFDGYPDAFEEDFLDQHHEGHFDPF